MNKKLYIIYLLTASLIFSGGCKDFLDVPPTEGEVPSEEALKNEQDLTNLLNSCYDLLAGGGDRIYGGKLQVIQSLLGDELRGDNLSGDFGEIYNRKSSIFGDYKTGVFEYSYKTINRTNIVLENLDLATINRNSIEGQAKFLRALCHFEMVRLFAQPYGYTVDNSHLGVPLRSSSVPSSGSRPPVSEAYAFVLDDLKSAEALLPDDNGNYASIWAAKALLARVYFQMNDYVNAYNYSNEVIQSGKFTFDADFATRFSPDGTPEAIFKLVNESNLNRFNELRNQFRSDGSSIPTLRIAQNFYSSATSNPNDRRKNWYTQVQGFGVLTKYNSSVFELPIIHLTEMKLTRAESAGELNDASKMAVGIQDLNDILARAYGNTIPPLATNSSAALVITTARQQRILEMVGEGDRLTQIKRIGASGENVITRGAPWNCPGMVLQFPQAEIANSVNFPKNPEGGCN
ncbi:RagB/SusD family nutrient uptake outer membrane protein [Solitalea sp. MAHUQ-68]|uniref:RagB/SusD family nutrient uptake outer membrane protein n=1 Tax=Solitalea agri TaxID=2953739 RepID=A0A9X2F548_9SPHI|nr:RagB/SusD family nutrient uptake outer membrane protein [Solitalea agri]MCO4294390.1 RagB/SusD family nutrient uptake outer membrane protein [Solitalea agri]